MSCGDAKKLEDALQNNDFLRAFNAGVKNWKRNIPFLKRPYHWRSLVANWTWINPKIAATRTAIMEASSRNQAIDVIATFLRTRGRTSDFDYSLEYFIYQAFVDSKSNYIKGDHVDRLEQATRYQGDRVWVAVYYSSNDRRIVIPKGTTVRIDEPTGRPPIISAVGNMSGFYQPLKRRVWVEVPTSNLPCFYKADRSVKTGEAASLRPNQVTFHQPDTGTSVSLHS